MMTSKTTQSKPGALDKLKKRLQTMANREIAVGFPAGESQTYPDGTAVLEVAAQHVFGVGVPERDFMAESSGPIHDNTRDIMAAIAKGITSGKAEISEIEELFKQAGLIGEAEIRNAIIGGDWEPNSDVPMSAALREKVSASWGIDIPHGMSYLAAKKEFRGSSKPLVDTGHLNQSVTFVVRDKK